MLLCRARRKRAEVRRRRSDLQGEADRRAGGAGGARGPDVPGRAAGAQDGHQGERRAQAEGQHPDSRGWAQDSG